MWIVDVKGIVLPELTFVVKWDQLIGIALRISCWTLFKNLFISLLIKSRKLLSATSSDFFTPFEHLQMPVQICGTGA